MTTTVSFARRRRPCSGEGLKGGACRPADAAGRVEGGVVGGDGDRRELRARENRAHGVDEFTRAQAGGTAY